MTKEQFKRFTKVTAASTIEGFGIGLVMAGIPGGIVGGGLGAVTGASGELLGRIGKKTLKLEHNFNLGFPDITHEDGLVHTHEFTQTRTLKDVPFIEIPDMIIASHFYALDRATGVLRKIRGSVTFETKMKNGEMKTGRTISFAIPRAKKEEKAPEPASK